MDTKVSVAVWVGIFVLVGVIMLLGLSLRVEKELFRKPEGLEILANFAFIHGEIVGIQVDDAGIAHFLQRTVPGQFTVKIRVSGKSEGQIQTYP